MALPSIVFDVPLFSSVIEREASEDILLHLMMALIRTNQIILTLSPNPPRLYKSGVFYEEEAGTERWKSIPEILKDGKGDCEDLSCWRAAELRNRGINAMPFVTWKRAPNGAYLYHAMLVLPNGTVEDPSRKLGMGSSPGTDVPYWTGGEIRKAGKRR